MDKICMTSRKKLVCLLVKNTNKGGENHPAYDNFIEFRLNEFMARGKMNPDECNKFIQNELIPELKKEIFNAKNSVSKNLNTYFQDVINPIYGIK
ncbi:MAG: hypothetical protein MUC38_13415 [Cyclobacteriaceae bacterium]|nr:hypothetical protein [Cyclobacteriaceae bacterium]